MPKKTSIKKVGTNQEMFLCVSTNQNGLEIVEITQNKKRFGVGIVFLIVAFCIFLCPFLFADIDALGSFALFIVSGAAFLLGLYLIWGREYIFFDHTNKTFSLVHQVGFWKWKNVFSFGNAKNLLVREEFVDEFVYYTYLIGEENHLVACHQNRTFALEFARYIGKKISLKVLNETEKL